MNKPGKSNYSIQVYIFSFLAALIVVAVYGWINSPGLQKTGTNYYPQLAIGFKKGQLSLPEQPSAALLALSDPYNYVLRKESNVEDFPWDVSLYKGKFYLYWGPVPSVLLTALPIGILSRMGDQHLVFPFMFGLFIYSMLFTVSFLLKFNHNLPAWTVLIALLAIGISMPGMLMLSRPKIYEASIVASQFFYIGGCYWAYSAVSEEGQPVLWKLALAGSHWALAIGSRSIILLAIAFFDAATLIYILKRIGIKNLTATLLAMGIPLFLGAIFFCWYNWARFDSIFELGLRYQLASVNYNEFNNLFSIRYVRENILSYIIRPYEIQSAFPYIITVENMISNDRLAGLPYASPYLLFLLVPIFRFFSPREAGAPKESPLEAWLVSALGGASAVSLVIILIYYFTAIRFTSDFVPGLLLLATIFFVQGNRSLKPSRGYLLLAVLLVFFSVSASTLIALPTSRVKEVLHYAERIFEVLGIR